MIHAVETSETLGQIVDSAKGWACKATQITGSSPDVRLSRTQKCKLVAAMRVARCQLLILATCGMSSNAISRTFSQKKRG
jgi:hypothetical protein